MTATYCVNSKDGILTFSNKLKATITAVEKAIYDKLNFLEEYSYQNNLLKHQIWFPEDIEEIIKEHFKELHSYIKSNPSTFIVGTIRKDIGANYEYHGYHYGTLKEAAYGVAMAKLKFPKKEYVILERERDKDLMAKFKDLGWEQGYLVAELNMDDVFSRHDNIDDAKSARDHFRTMYPDMNIVIFERTSLHTWEGRFLAKEATINVKS